MRNWLITSAILHLVVLLLLWLGLPTIAPKIPEAPPIIPVDIATLADITATKIQDQPPAKKEEIKPEPPKPEPPKVEEKKPEPPPLPTPPPPSEANARKQDVKPETKEEKKPEPEKDAESLEPPKPKEKPKDKKPEPKKEEPKADPLASVLKNVAKLKTPTPPEKTETKQPPKETPPPASSAPSSPITAPRLSISEEDALRRQIMQCWNVPIGAKDIETMAVEIVIMVNPDRTLKEAMVVDQARMGRDPFFRTVAESAMRALQNPLCTPLALPPEKVNQWKEIQFTFNPRDMF